MAFFRRFSPIAAVALVAAAAAPQAAGSVFTPGPLTQASLLNPLADCPPDGAGVNFVNAEVEPFLGVNPRNDANLIGVYQQDRYSNGGSKGSVAAVSQTGGATWANVRSRPTRAARAGAISARRIRGCRLAPTASPTR